MDPIRYQAEEHPLVMTEGFQTPEAYCLYLMHSKAYELVVEMADKRAVLDLGCNQGYGTARISQHSRQTLGLDVSPTAIDEARRLFEADTLRFDVYDGKCIPADTDTFDLVSSLQVIEHVADYASYLGEITRVMQPGGDVVFTTPNAAIRLDTGMKPWYPLHVREFTANELEALLSEWFDEVRIQGLFAVPDLYNVEYQRVSEQRLIARRAALSRLHPVRLKQTVASQARRYLPNSAVRGLQRAYRILRQRHQDGVAVARNSDGDNSWEHYTTAELFYRDDQLDDALDLLAICRYPKRV